MVVTVGDTGGPNSRKRLLRDQVRRLHERVVLSMYYTPAAITCQCAPCGDSDLVRICFAQCSGCCAGICVCIKMQQINVAHVCIQLSGGGGHDSVHRGPLDPSLDLEDELSTHAMAFKLR